MIDQGSLDREMFFVTKTWSISEDLSGELGKWVSLERLR